jgi:hypothetical protein
MVKYSLLAGALTVALVSGAHATTFFTTETTATGDSLNLTGGQSLTTSTGTVVDPEDITIDVDTASDFASGNAQISPSADILLTTLTFTPTDPNAFSDFTFRGQDVAANQTIDVTVQDNQGNPAETFSFTQAQADQDFSAIGITALSAGETIQSVQISNSGGFKSVKQIDFSLAGSDTGVAEPATWALMILGVGMVGAGVRRRQNAPLAT